MAEDLSPEDRLMRKIFEPYASLQAAIDTLQACMDRLQERDERFLPAAPEPPRRRSTMSPETYAEWRETLTYPLRCITSYALVINHGYKYYREMLECGHFSPYVFPGGKPRGRTPQRRRCPQCARRSDL